MKNCGSFPSQFCRIRHVVERVWLKLHMTAGLSTTSLYHVTSQNYTHLRESCIIKLDSESQACVLRAKIKYSIYKFVLREFDTTTSMACGTCVIYVWMPWDQSKVSWLSRCLKYSNALRYKFVPCTKPAHTHGYKIHNTHVPRYNTQWLPTSIQ